jgi:hypothetical protein
MFGIKKLLRQILERLQMLEESTASHDGKSAQSAEQLALRVSELSSAANRHDMAIEDLLDSWEELQEKQKEETRALSAALTETAARQDKEARGREKALLELAMKAHDLFFGFQRAAAEAGSETWNRQLALAELKLAEARLPASFQVIDKAGVPICFAVHEVVSVIPTQDAAQDRLIAEVYACGYVYMGRVLRKAQVSAWRLMGSVSEESTGGESA